MDLIVTALSPLIEADHSLHLNGMVITCRISDGFVNLTELCKAGGKEYFNWKKNRKTTAFLEALSTSIRIRRDALFAYQPGLNEERATWGHPQVAINIAQWLSPEIDVKVSKWVFELMTTGKVELEKEGSSTEIDTAWKAKLEELENKIQEKDIDLYTLKRRHKSVQSVIETHKAGFYIISDATQSSESVKFKVGIDTVNVAARLDQHRTTIAALRIDYLVYLSVSDCKLLEKAVLRRYEKERFPYVNHEWIFDVPVNNMIKAAKTIIKYLRMDHEYEDQIVMYNEHPNYLHELTLKKNYGKETKDPASKVDGITTAVKSQEAVQLKIEHEMLEVNTKLDKLLRVRTDMTTYKLTDLRKKLEEYEQNNSGPKLTVFERLMTYIDAQIKLLQSSITKICMQGAAPAAKLAEAIKDNTPEIAPVYKQCSKCDKVKTITEYYISTRSDDGYRDRCKMCFDTRIIGTGKCIDCDGSISKRASRCKSCNAKCTANRTSPNKPTKEAFIEMLSTMKQKDMADKLGVSKSTIIKWKKEYCC